jgi:hypothetical protein
MVKVAAYKYMDSRVKLEDALHLGRHAERERANAHGAPRTDAGLLAEDVPEQLADAVDH